MTDSPLYLDEGEQILWLFPTIVFPIDQLHRHHRQARTRSDNSHPVSVTQNKPVQQ